MNKSIYNKLNNAYFTNKIVQVCKNLKCGKISKLEQINIFTMPSRINDKDIISMFKGLLSLMNEKSNQQQTEKYLTLKLKYERLKFLYTRLKNEKKENRNSL